MNEMNKSAPGYPRAKSGGHDADELDRVGIALLIIKLPDSRALRVISRSLFLAMILLALPSLGSIIRASSDAPLYDPDADLGVADGFKILPILLRDLVDEGLVGKGHQGFVLGAGIRDVEDGFKFLRDAGVDLLTSTDLRRKKVNAHQVFDFVIAPSFRGIQLVGSILKDGGLAVSPLRHDPSHEQKLPANFKLVYLRRFESTMVAMRKSEALSNGGIAVAISDMERVSYGTTPEEKQAALKGLEDVYLEPPRRTTLATKSSFTSRKIKFLPDLLKDPLDKYPRRVFISDDSGALDWFYTNYPMRDQEFEVHDVNPEETDVSSWITMNMRREDYVVMKAEAQVVEELLKNNTLFLVDELFLECKNQWQDGEEESRSKRAYWQCLNLYGKVRDEGIAVHQWWY